MNKKALTEANIRTKFITPALVGVDGAKWNVMTQIREEAYFTRGRGIVRGKTVDLTAFEFKLLTAFIRSGGKLLSRERLLDLVWGSGSFVTDRVVDNHVVTLRKKVEPEPSHPRYIFSVRGLGYRFDG